jgi:hypothetical protein
VAAANENVGKPKNHPVDALVAKPVDLETLGRTVGEVFAWNRLPLDSTSERNELAWETFVL